MKNPHNLGLGLLTILIFCLSTAAAELPVKQFEVGVVLVLSGPVAMTGTSVQRAIQLADEQLDKNDQVKFIFEDDQFQPRSAVSAAEKLISQDGVDALITFSGSTSLAVSAVAERKHKPMIALTPLPAVSANRRDIYTVFVPTSAQIALFNDTIRKFDFKRIAVVTTSQDALLQIKNAFVAANREAIVRDEEIIPGDVSLGALVTKVLAQKPDVIVNLTLPPQISVLSKLFREQGFKGKFLGGPPLYSPGEIAAAKGALTGAWLPGPKSGASDTFLSQYRAKYNDTCVSEGIYGYDAAALLIEALKSGDLVKFLSDAKSFKGLAGTYPKNVGTNQFEVPAELKEIGADGALSPVK